MTTALHAAESIYRENEKWIYEICHRHVRRYGGEIEEIISRANLLFVQQALPFYNPDRSEFTNWLHTVLSRGLAKSRRAEFRRKKKVKWVSDEVMQYMGERQALPFQDELTSDAQEVIRLALALPKTLRREAKNMGGAGVHKRRCIYEYLRGSDWSHKRIMRAFREIKESL